MYTWGYIKNAALAKLDLDGDYVDQNESNELNWQNRFYIYANEVITQVCSSIKPKHTFCKIKTFDKVIVNDEGKLVIDGVKYEDLVISNNGDNILDANGNIVMHRINTPIRMPYDFIAFGDDVCTVKYYDFLHNQWYTECHDDTLQYFGYNHIICKVVGDYTISYKARWFTFTNEIDDNFVLDIPLDILDCIPSYIASQCYKVDDEYKSSVFRNEYEMFLARIDDTNFKNTKTFTIGGDW